MPGIDRTNPFENLQMREVERAIATICRLGDLAAYAQNENDGCRPEYIEDQFNAIQTALDTARNRQPVEEVTRG